MPVVPSPIRGLPILLSVVLLLLQASATAGAATPVDGCTTISAPGEYELVSDLVSEGSCIDIEAHDVSLDLAGHTITFDTSSRGGTWGIRISWGRRHVTVSNGTIRQGGSGAETRGGDAAVLCDECNSPTISNLEIDVDGFDTTGILVRQGGTCSADEVIRILDNRVHHGGTRLSSRDAFSSIPIRVAGARSRVEILRNTITGSPQAGIFVSHSTAGCGDGSEIAWNTIDIDDAVYANAAGIVSYRGGAYDIHHNNLVGDGMEGIQLDQNHYQAGDHRTRVHDNVLRLDYQYTALGHSAGVGILQGIRIRYQPEQIDIYDNDILVHSDSAEGSEQNDAYGIWITMNRGEGGPGRDVRVWNNTVRAEGTGDARRAVALRVDGVDDACGTLEIHDNEFRSNNVIAVFSNAVRSDTAMLHDNVFGFLEGERHAPATFLLDWGRAGEVTAPAILDATFTDGAAPDDIAFGSGESGKRLSTWWTLIVQVVDGAGAPQPGAEVVISDRAGNTVARGTTGTDGRWSGPIMEKQATTAGVEEFTPHSVQASKDGRRTTAVVRVDHPDVSVTLVLDGEPGNDCPDCPEAVGNLRRDDVH